MGRTNTAVGGFDAFLRLCCLVAATGLADARTEAGQAADTPSSSLRCAALRHHPTSASLTFCSRS